MDSAVKSLGVATAPPKVSGLSSGKGVDDRPGSGHITVLQYAEAFASKGKVWEECSGRISVGTFLSMRRHHFTLL